jgi:hypothetical protein
VSKLLQSNTLFIDSEYNPKILKVLDQISFPYQESAPYNHPFSVNKNHRPLAKSSGRFFILTHLIKIVVWA